MGGVVRAADVRVVGMMMWWRLRTTFMLALVAGLIAVGFGRAPAAAAATGGPLSAICDLRSGELAYVAVTTLAALEHRARLRG